MDFIYYVYKSVSADYSPERENLKKKNSKVKAHRVLILSDNLKQRTECLSCLSE